MTFTDEPSIMWNGRFGVRIEDVIVCEETAAAASTATRRSSWPTAS